MVPPQESSEVGSSSESEGGDPLPKAAKRYRRERDGSSDEENIPLAELAGRLKARKQRLEREQKAADRHVTSDEQMSGVSDESMSVNDVRRKRERGKDSDKVKNLLRAIVSIL